MKFIKYFTGIAFITLVTQILMMVRSMYMAKNFGINFEMDAYNIANVLTVSITSVVSAAITTVLIPSLSKPVSSVEERQGINTYVIVLTFLSISFVFLFVIFGKPIIHLFTLNYQSDDRSLIYALTLILAASQVFKVLSGISTAYLQTNSDFVTPKMAGLIASLVSISYLILSPDPNIFGVTIFLGVSFVVEFILMLKKRNLSKTKIRFSFKMKNPTFEMLIKNTAPILLSSAAFQISLIFSNFIASYYGEGFISIFGYGNQIINIFHGLIVLNIITMLYPNLARKFSENLQLAKDSLVNYINLTNMLIIPIVFGFIAVGDLIVEILYQRGNFTEQITQQVYIISSIIFLSFPINTARDFVYRSFYCLNDTKTPSRNSLYVVGISILLILALMPFFKVYSIAIGPVLSSMISLLMSYRKLKKKIGIIGKDHSLLKNNITFTFIGMIMCLILFLLKGRLTFLINVPVVELTLLIFVGILIYLVLLYFIKGKYILNIVRNLK
jgi:putative peptidoglycan lipid II flippase